MAEIEVYVSAAPVRVDVSGAQGPAGIDDPQSAFSTNKASIANDDRFAMLDSASANIPKHTLWSLIKSTLKTYFDSVYHTTGGALGTPASGNLANCTFPTLNQNTTGNAATVTTINGRISAGSNVTLSGSGTAASPYVIAASGGGGGGSSAWGDLTGVPPEISGTTASFTTEQETKLAGIEEGATADQDLSGLAPLANPTFTGTVTIPAGASIDGYLTTTTAASTYAPISTTVTLTGTQTLSGKTIDETGIYIVDAEVFNSRLITGAIDTLVYAGSRLQRESGDGQFLTNLNGSQIASGSIPVARIATALTTPGPIGGTTPAAVSATTVTASGAASALSLSVGNGTSVGAEIQLGNDYSNRSGIRVVVAAVDTRFGYGGGAAHAGTWTGAPLRFFTGGVQRAEIGASGGFSITGNLTASGTVTEGVYTVATTPTHSLGASIRINNATGATIGGVVAGTGSQHVVARSNGTQWICTAIIIP